MNLKNLIRGGFSTRQAQTLQKQASDYREVSISVTGLDRAQSILPVAVASSPLGHRVFITMPLLANTEIYIGLYASVADAAFSYAYLAVYKLADSNGIPVAPALWYRENTDGGTTDGGAGLGVGQGNAAFTDGTDTGGIKVVAAGHYAIFAEVDWTL